MPGTVTVPSVLKGHAATIWRAAFLSAYDGTCKERRDQRDSCAAAVAWSAVKNKYRKNDKGDWVERQWTGVLTQTENDVQRHSTREAVDIQRANMAGQRMSTMPYPEPSHSGPDGRGSSMKPAKAKRRMAADMGGGTTALEVARNLYDDEALFNQAVPGLAQRGGPGSGHFGHAGRPGEIGGSAGEGGGTKQTVADRLARDAAHPAALPRFKLEGYPSPNILTYNDEDYHKWVRNLAKDNTTEKLRRWQDVVNAQLKAAPSHRIALEQMLWQAALTDAVGVKNFGDWKMAGTPTWLKGVQDEVTSGARPKTDLGIFTAYKSTAVTMSDQITNREAPAQVIGSGATPLDTAEYPTPLGTVGPRSELPWMKAFLGALEGQCASAPDPYVCAMNAANRAIGQPAEEDSMAQQHATVPTVQRDFVPVHPWDLGDYPLPFVIRREFSPEKRHELAEKGHALPDGSYPIENKGDLTNAISAFGRAPESKRKQVAAHIRKRAKELGALDEVSGQWGGKADEQKSLAERAVPIKAAQSRMGDKSGQHKKVGWNDGQVYDQKQDTEPQGEDETYGEAERDPNPSEAEESDPSDRNEGMAAGDDIKDEARPKNPAGWKLSPASPGPASQADVYDGGNVATSPKPADMQSPTSAGADVGALGTSKKDQEAELARMEEARKRGEKHPAKLPQVGATGVAGMMSMTDRAILRAIEAREDMALLASPDVDREAPCPRGMDRSEWLSRPAIQRTYRALIVERMGPRTYDESVERTVAEGWQAIPNPTRQGERIFQRYVDTPDGMLLTRAILVRSAGQLDWHLRTLTRGASLSLAVQVPEGERRFGDVRPFEDLMEARGQPNLDVPLPDPIIKRDALSSGRVQTFTVREAVRGMRVAPVPDKKGTGDPERAGQTPEAHRKGRETLDEFDKDLRGVNTPKYTEPRPFDAALPLGPVNQSLATRFDEGEGEGGPSESVESGARSGAMSAYQRAMSGVASWLSGMKDIESSVKSWAMAYAEYRVNGAKGEAPKPSQFGVQGEEHWWGQRNEIDGFLADMQKEPGPSATTSGDPQRTGQKPSAQAAGKSEEAQLTEQLAAHQKQGARVSDATGGQPWPTKDRKASERQGEARQAEHTTELRQTQKYGAGGIINQALTGEQQSQLKRAQDRLSLDDRRTRIVGGMTREEAQGIVKALTGQTPDEQGRDETQTETASDQNVYPKKDEKKGNPY